MNRLALVIALTLGGPAFAADKPEPRGMKDALRAYRKAYATVVRRQEKARQRLGGVSYLNAESNWRNQDFKRAATLIGGAASREELVEQQKAELERGLLAADQRRIEQKQRQPVRRLLRALSTVLPGRRGASGEQPKVDQAKLQDGLASYARDLDHAELQIASFESAIKEQGLHQIDLSRPYGNAFVRDPGKLGQAVSRIARKLSHQLPLNALERFEGALMSRVTQHIVAEHGAFEAHLQTTAPPKLYAEAMQLLRDVHELSAERPEEAVGAPLGGEHAIYVRHPSVLQIRPTRDGSAFNSVYRMFDGAVETGGKLPVEVRLLLEKAVRASAIAKALGSRSPELAAQLRPLIENAKIVVHLPVGKMLNLRGEDLPYDVEYTPVTVHVARPAAGMLELVQSGIVDPVRAKMLRDELDQQMGDLDGRLTQELDR
jgi:hypothetical protein